MVLQTAHNLRSAYGEFFSILSLCTSSRHVNPVQNYQLPDRSFNLKKQTQKPDNWKTQLYTSDSVIMQKEITAWLKLLYSVLINECNKDVIVLKA